MLSVELEIGCCLGVNWMASNQSNKIVDSLSFESTAFVCSQSRTYWEYEWTKQHHQRQRRRHALSPGFGSIEKSHISPVSIYVFEHHIASYVRLFRLSAGFSTMTTKHFFIWAITKKKICIDLTVTTTEKSAELHWVWLPRVFMSLVPSHTVQHQRMHKWKTSKNERKCIQLWPFFLSTYFSYWRNPFVCGKFNLLPLMKFTFISLTARHEKKQHLRMEINACTRAHHKNVVQSSNASEEKKKLANNR